ncbi:MAG: recombinase family protein [Eubacterium sp.]|nr:recombinase family protein [Eubacterium sp.]
MIHGYIRVSTQNQGRYGNSQEAQMHALEQAGMKMCWVEEFTGTTKNRPVLDELLSMIGKGDTLVVTKLDRLARSTIDGIEIVEELLEKGVTVNVLNMGVMDDTPTGKLIRNIFFSFAQFERDMIIERTREGKEIARQKEGWHEGRPKKTISITRVKELLRRQQNGEITVSDCCEALNISKSKWYLLLQELNFID